MMKWESFLNEKKIWVTQEKQHEPARPAHSHSHFSHYSFVVLSQIHPNNKKTRFKIPVDMIFM